MRVIHRLIWASAIGLLAGQLTAVRADVVLDAGAISTGTFSNINGNFTPNPAALFLFGQRPGPGIEGAVKFDIRSIPSTLTISSAVLRLQAGQSVASIGSFHVLSVLGYSSTTPVVTPNDFGQPLTSIGGAFIPAGNPPPPPITIPYDVTNFVQSLVSSPTPFVGFHIRIDMGQVVVTGGSDPTFGAPELIVTSAVPEPSSLVTSLIVVVLATGWHLGRRLAKRAAVSGHFFRNEEKKN
jgi:hypothetical protein